MRTSPSYQYFLLFGSIAFFWAFFLPNFTYPYLGFYREFAAYVAMFFFIGAAMVLRTPFTLPAGAAVFSGICLAVVLLQYFAGVVVYRSNLLLLLPYLLMLMLAFSCGGIFYRGLRGGFPKTAAALIATAAFFHFIVCFIQWFDLNENYLFVFDQMPFIRVAGNMAQPNHLATVMVMGIAAAFYLYRIGFIGALLFSLATLLFSVAVIWSESFAGLLSVWVFVFYAGFVALRHRADEGELRKFLPLLLLAVFVSVLFYTLPEIKQFILNGEFTNREPNAGSRLKIYQAVFAALSQQPLLGYGWLNGWKAVQSAVAAQPIMMHEAPLYVHNLFLDLLLWNGIPVGMVLIAMLAYWGISRYFFLRDKTVKLFAALVIPFWVHSMLEFPFAFAYFAFFAALVCGYLDAAYAAEKKYTFKGIVLPKKILAVLLVAAVGYAGFIFKTYYTVEQQYISLRLLIYRIGTPVYREKHMPFWDNFNIEMRYAHPHLDLKNLTDEETAEFAQWLSRYHSPYMEARYMEVLLHQKNYREYYRRLRIASSTNNLNYSVWLDKKIEDDANLPAEVKNRSKEILQPALDRADAVRQKMALESGEDEMPPINDTAGDGADKDRQK